MFYAPLEDLLDEKKGGPAEAYLLKFTFFIFLLLHHSYELGFQFMTALIEGQYNQLTTHRTGINITK